MVDLTKQEATAKSVAMRAALAGNSKNAGVWNTDFQPYCDSPATVEIATPSYLPGRPYATAMDVPCRKCSKCLQFRQLQWADRIEAESKKSLYNYFLTLTFSDLHLGAILSEGAASKYEGEKAVLTAGYKHVQQYIKRLRKGRSVKETKEAPRSSLAAHRAPFAALKLRYFVISEYGEKRGRLHYHAIFHTERWVDPEILKREWRSRAYAELVRDPRQAGVYCSKYLTKNSGGAVIRASNLYGKTSPPDHCRNQDAAATAGESFLKFGEHDGTSSDLQNNQPGLSESDPA